MKFPHGFDHYPCVFDSIRMPVAHGVSLIAEIHHDDDTTPEEFDCYSDDQIAAWNKDEWQYCGVELVLDMAGSRRTLGSLWGIDLHLMDGKTDSEYLTSVANELLAEHQGEVADALTDMADRLRLAATQWRVMEKTK